MKSKAKKIADAISALTKLGMLRAQQNERSAVSLLALLELRPGMEWAEATNPLVGITPLMRWAKAHYGRDDAPNTRETFRRQTMHQLVDAGIALYNPDDPHRPVNSPASAYQISPPALELLRTFGTAAWQANLTAFLKVRPTLADQYAAARQQHRIAVTLPDGRALSLTPGIHSLLIKNIIEDFAPRFAPGSLLVYVGDTGTKSGHLDDPLLAGLGIMLDSHGKFPDVVLHDVRRNWLLLVESVTSHGPVDGKRYGELQKLFARCTAGLVYVTAFPSREMAARYIPAIAWETEVWIADSPSHLIHFNGVRFLGPYPESV